MTPEQWMRKGLNAYHEGGARTLEACMEQAITAAIEEEREACAKIADNQMRERLDSQFTAEKNGHINISKGYRDLGAQCKLIVEAIRARGNKK